MGQLNEFDKLCITCPLPIYPFVVVAMVDYDAQVLDQAYQAIYMIDLRYRQANFNDKVQLKPHRDQAFNALISARLKLLEEGMICTAADVTKMAELKEQISKAAQTQSLLKGIGGVIKFLGIF